LDSNIATRSDCSKGCTDGSLHVAHDTTMGFIESTALGPLIQRQQQREHHATRTGDNRRASAHAPKHVDPISLACFKIDFQGNLGRSAYDNTRFGHLPQSKEFSVGC
jgi:hypothetical protein